MTDNEMWIRIWCRKVVCARGEVRYEERSPAEKDRMRRSMMRRYPGRFTAEQLRAAGMTRKGTRRKRREVSHG